MQRRIWALTLNHLINEISVQFDGFLQFQYTALLLTLLSPWQLQALPPLQKASRFLLSAFCVLRAACWLLLLG